MEWVLLIVFVGLVCGLGARAIAISKGREGAEGFCLGFFFGPIGLIIEGFLSPEGQSKARPDGRQLRKCPHCAEMILAESKVCRYCNRDVPNTPAIDEAKFYVGKKSRLYHNPDCPTFDKEDATPYTSLAEIPPDCPPCAYCRPN